MHRHVTAVGYRLATPMEDAGKDASALTSSCSALTSSQSSQGSVLGPLPSDGHPLTASTSAAAADSLFAHSGGLPAPPAGQSRRPPPAAADKLRPGDSPAARHSSGDVSAGSRTFSDFNNSSFSVRPSEEAAPQEGAAPTPHRDTPARPRPGGRPSA